MPVSVILPPNSTGTPLDVIAGTSGTTARQIVTLGDPSTAANQQSVSAAGSAQVYTPDVASAATALGASNAAVSVALAGQGGVGVLISSGGNLVGTITPEISYDGGTTWVAAYFFNAAMAAQLGVPPGGLAQTIVVSSPGSALLSILVGPGVSNARVRVSSYSSGSSNATMRASHAGMGSIVFNSPLDGGRATYSSAIVGMALATSATDVFTIAGAAGKVIRILRIQASLTITTAAQYLDVSVVKRSALDTGGTATNPACVPYDSSSPAAAATVAAYTGNPSLGTAVGVVAAEHVFAPLTGTPAAGVPLCTFDFGDRSQQALVLRSAAQQVAVNLNTTGNVGVGSFWAVWTEE
jgi:hypothetical protein